MKYGKGFTMESPKEYELRQLINGEVNLFEEKKAKKISFPKPETIMKGLSLVWLGYTLGRLDQTIITNRFK